MTEITLKNVSDADLIQYQDLDRGDYFTIPGVRDTVYLKASNGPIIVFSDLSTGSQGNNACVSPIHLTKKISKITWELSYDD